jgi:hypothetical protein
MTNVAIISAIKICNKDEKFSEKCNDIKPRITAIMYAAKTVKSPLVFVVIY